MKKKSISKLFLTFVCLPLLLSACNNNSNSKDYSNDKRFKIYQLALADGYSGTYEEWLASIKGTDGKDGHSPIITIGENGNWFIDGVDTGVKAQGENGKDGQDGKDGENGKDGKSAYELYCEANPEYTGTEEEWLDDLINGRLGNVEKHIVTFYVNEEVFAVQEIEHSHLADRPDAEPIELGKTFDGWYSDDDEKWLFNRYAVYDDLNLYARFINEPFTYRLSDNQAYVVSYIGDEEEVTIPAMSGGYDVVGIDDNAFENCLSIREATIPSTILSIGTSIFSGCKNLVKVYYNSVFAPSEQNVFLNIPSLKEVVFNGSCVPTNICNNCANITNVTINNNVTYINGRAFRNCTKLETVNFNINRLSMSGRYQFFGCTSLKTIRLPEGLTYLDLYAFQGCTNLEEIYIPSTLTYFGDRPFWDCYSIRKVHIASIESWCKISFDQDDLSSSYPAYCGAKIYLNEQLIENLVVPSSVSKIPNYGFNSPDVKTVVLPYSVVLICDYAFNSCNELTATYYEGTLEEWNQISIGTGNTYLTNNVYYYSESEPTEPGNYWHYVSGIPTVW